MKAAIGAVVGLMLARMAYLMFAVPQQSCSDAWVRSLQRAGLLAFR